MRATARVPVHHPPTPRRRILLYQRVGFGRPQGDTRGFSDADLELIEQFTEQLAVTGQTNNESRN